MFPEESLRLRVLGSAAGGGFPQWNCGCPNCRGVREGAIRAKARSQESLAVSRDGRGWFLLNASPEIRQQIESFGPLHPRSPRDTPIEGIVLTNGDMDHCLGLLSLRESYPITVHSTEQVHRGFTEGNVLYRTLERFEGQVTWRTLPVGREVDLALQSGKESGLRVEALPVPGKAPVHLEHRGESGPGDNVALKIRDTSTGKVFLYASAVGGITPELRSRLEGVDCVFLDGTFWSSSELIDGGLGTKRAEDMAHVPLGGVGGSIAALSGTKIGRKIFIHINNTNPILRDDSPERLEVDAAGWEIAWDGMEVLL